MPPRLPILTHTAHPKNKTGLFPQLNYPKGSWLALGLPAARFSGTSTTPRRHLLPAHPPHFPPTAASRPAITRYHPRAPPAASRRAVAGGGNEAARAQEGPGRPCPAPAAAPARRPSPGPSPSPSPRGRHSAAQGADPGHGTPSPDAGDRGTPPASRRAPPGALRSPPPGPTCAARLRAPPAGPANPLVVPEAPDSGLALFASTPFGHFRPRTCPRPRAAPWARALWSGARRKPRWRPSRCSRARPLPEAAAGPQCVRSRRRWRPG